MFQVIDQMIPGRDSSEELDREAENEDSEENEDDEDIERGWLQRGVYSCNR